MDMKILMIAPEPIFEPRGTPLSVVGRLKALSDMGHQVDLLTYNFGEDVDLPGIRIFRIPRIPGIGRVKIGPSLVKIPMDILLFIKTGIRLLRGRYDLIHSHEEAGFWGAIFSRIFHVPHIYDMHSSLPQQLRNFEFTSSRVIFVIFKKLEKWVLKYSSGVITICPDLYNYVKNLFPDKGSVLIENVVDYSMIFGEKDRSSEIRRELNLKGRIVALYTGTFESYQGLDLIIQSAENVVSKSSRIIFLLVGGHADQVEAYKKKVLKRGLADHFIFTGQVMPQEVNSYVKCADILLSPRTTGTNTPLKIYSYLRSGVAIVATRLWTHTQVLNDRVAVLTDPDPESFARGILSLIEDPTLCKRVGRAGEAMAERKYSYTIYMKRYREVMHQVVGRRA
jgi:glycosyltransferase involved in cell wall biosynthesis